MSLTDKLGLTVSFDNTPILMKYFHSHNAYEIYLLISGKTTYLLNEDICNMKEGEIMLISPGVFHKTQSESRRRFLFEIKESYLDKYFTKEGKEFITKPFKTPHLKPSSEQFNKIISLLNELTTVIQTETDKTLSLTLEIFKILSECPVAVKDLTPSEKLVEKIIDYINNKYNEINGIEEVAEKFFVNKSYFCRLFKKNTGISFVKYLNNVRLKKSATLLIYSNKDVSEIATACGFNSTSYFCNVFKNEFHQSPLEYREGKDINNFY